MNLISGLSSTLALNVLDRTKSAQITAVRDTAVHSRAIEAFLEKIGDVETVDDLINDYDSYSFVMKAFDLEDEIYGKGLIKKMLSEDSEDDGALVNVLTESRFENLYDAMGFSEEGTKTSKTSSYLWKNDIVNRYLERQYINDQADQNSTVGIILEVQEKLEDVANWYNVLADEDLTEFFRTALGIPDETAQIDIDQQAEIFADKMDIEDLKDSEIMAELTTRYAIIADALAASESFSSNAAIQLMTRAASFGSSSDSFQIVTFDISAVSFSASSIYR